MHANVMCIILSTDIEVSGGEVVVIAKYGILTLFKETYQVCDIVEGGCPILGELLAINVTQF